MKKLFLLFVVISFVFVSCQKETEENAPTPSVKKELWDAENIAYTNTDSITKNVYGRLGGTTGIIGTFHEEGEVFIGASSYIHKTHYEFYDTGYYYTYHNDSSLKIFEKTGIYRIKKVTDSYFQIDFYSDEKNSSGLNIPRGSSFYQVTNDALCFEDFIKIGE